jgi:ATP-binding cassette subfamily B multidrug efflux pump
MVRQHTEIIKSYIFKHTRMWVWGVIAIALTTIFTMAAPWILRQAVNSLQAEVTAQKLVIYALAIVAVTIIQGVFRFLMRQTMIVTSRNIEYEIRNDLFDHLLKLDRPYYDKTPTGDIMARLTNDLEAVRGMVGPGIMYFINTLFTFAVAVTLMCIINVKLTLIALIPLPVISTLAYFLSKEVHKRYARIQEQYSTITTEVQENLSGIRVVKAYVQEDNAIKRFGRLNRDYIRKNMDMIKVWGLFFPAIFGLASMGVVFVLWIGGNQVIGKIITLGDLVAFTAYLMLLMWPMAALGWVMGLYQRGMASMKRIARIFNSAPVIQTISTGAVKKTIEGKIEFKNLNFAYNGKPVLNNINLSIAPGQTVALLGHTGSGKTSLVSLIPRLYPVNRGMLTIDDIDVNDFDLHGLRAQIGFVAQETILFSQPIESNIAFGNELDKTEIVNSAGIAGIADDIDSFPQHYKTILGERGITLSGGQKQRTALARALAIKPKILILDDSFSSVDTATEEQILQNLKQVFSKCTTLIISHRISTVKNSDLIVVLENGRIAEQGSHRQLLEVGGLYARLYEQQLLKQELEAL